MFVEDIGKYSVGILIDELTNSIENVHTGDVFPTLVLPINLEDLKITTKSRGWKFNWKLEFKLRERELFKLTIVDNPQVIHGLVSISDHSDHYYLNLIESAPFNLGKNKVYKGVPGNLFAFTCKVSFEKGYDGFVSFTSKTKLIEHYENTIGAIHIGGHKMVIFPDTAQILIAKYFNK